MRSYRIAILRHGRTAANEDGRIIGKTDLPLSEDAGKPRFRECAKHPHAQGDGYVLYYTDQCPFNAKYVPIVEKTAEEHGIPFRAIHLTDREQARNAPTPVTTYALFLDGEYLTNEQMNDTRFLKLAADRTPV